ncbi:MAG: lysophospholipid acyltransferase family protein [Planctomycetota bacterium]
MKIKVRGMRGFAGRMFSRFVNVWMRTLRYEAVFADRSLDPLEQIGGPRIYLVWHENLLAPLYLRPYANVAILVSRHRDADVLEAIAHESGFDCVRGSTNRGGVAALRQLAARGEQQHLVITPDGPRGPRRQIAAGPIYLASKLQLPIVPIAVAYDRNWRLRSWDRFAVPRPFTVGRVVLGNELHVRGDLDRAGIEQRRAEIERVFLRLSDEVEAWAATGKTRPDAVPGWRERPSDARPREQRLAA